ncbi:MAG: hypothetical protein HQL96_11030 [Magnetococcales bacterium]|nr:hypothetical protein [Magnetococcales bacterium]
MAQRIRETRTPQYVALDYSISISDVMSALLFVFIVILIMFSFNMSTSESDFREEYQQAAKERERLEEINAEKEEKLKKLKTSVAELRELASNLKHDFDLQQARTAQLLYQLLTDIQQELISKENLRVHIDPNLGILRLPNEILFPLGSAQFAPGGEEILEKLARVLEHHLPCYTGKVDEASRPSFCLDRQWNPGTLDAVFIEGHTDNMPLVNAKSFSNNLHLSGMRAIRTYETLMAASIQAPLMELRNRKGQTVFGISGYGEYRPVVGHATPTPEPANRRIDVRFFLVNPKPPEAIPQVFEGLDRLTEKLGELK